MRILGINASPRSRGNSDILLDKALEGAASAGALTVKLELNDLRLTPVQEEEYEKVSPSGLSVIDDDMAGVFRDIAESDAIVLASPIFFGSLTAQAKIMIDRFQCVWLARNVFGMSVFEKAKKGCFICVEASDRKDFFENARSIVRNFFATANIEYAGELFVPGADKKGSVLERPEVLEKARELGERLARNV